MNLTAVKIIRFVMNFAFYSVILIALTYFVYTTPPDFYGLKNAIVPMQATIILTIFASMGLAIINEITTLFIIRITKRQK